MPAEDLGEQGFLGPSQIGPSQPEAADGHSGPFNPVSGASAHQVEDPLGYLELPGRTFPFKPATEPPKGT